MAIKYQSGDVDPSLSGCCLSSLCCSTLPSAGLPRHTPAQAELHCHKSKWPQTEHIAHGSHYLKATSWFSSPYVILSFSELLGMQLRLQACCYSYRRVNSRKRRACAPHGHGVEDTCCEASAASQLIPMCILYVSFFCRVNILKISFKRKKFFIHQRQKQVSYVYACFVSCVFSHFSS